MSKLCQTCETAVSDRFAAVFGDNQDRVENCYNCRTKEDVRDGVAFSPDRPSRMRFDAVTDDGDLGGGDS